MPAKDRHNCVIAAALFMLVCGCQRDLTYEPSAHFSQLAGRCLELRQELFLTQSSYANYRIAVMSHGEMPQSIERYNAEDSSRTNPGYSRIVTYLPAGTHIRVERLVEDPKETFEVGNGPRPLGKIIDGEQKGKTIVIGVLLTDVTGQWELRGSYAQPCQ